MSTAHHPLQSASAGDWAARAAVVLGLATGVGLVVLGNPGNPGKSQTGQTAGPEAQRIACMLPADAASAAL